MRTCLIALPFVKGSTKQSSSDANSLCVSYSLPITPSQILICGLYGPFRWHYHPLFHECGAFGPIHHPPYELCEKKQSDPKSRPQTKGYLSSIQLFSMSNAFLEIMLREGLATLQLRHLHVPCLCALIISNFSTYVKGKSCVSALVECIVSAVVPYKISRRCDFVAHNAWRIGLQVSQSGIHTID